MLIEQKKYLLRTETRGTVATVFQACGVALPPTLQTCCVSLRRLTSRNPLTLQNFFNVVLNDGSKKQLVSLLRNASLIWIPKS